jgi:hypothetical protein
MKKRAKKETGKKPAAKTGSRSKVKKPASQRGSNVKSARQSGKRTKVTTGKPKTKTTASRKGTKARPRTGTRRASVKQPDMPPLQEPEILIWEDDPESEGAAPVVSSVPGDPTSRFQLNIIGNDQPPPAKYQPGTPEFRYWTARAALVRARDFWTPILPDDAAWQTGAQLPITLNAGVQLNAFYNRWNGLTFYQDTQDGKVIHTADSADIACHEFGHAVLDALQPAIWFAQVTEIAAFHEAFGDLSALLTGLHLDSLCAHVLGRHGGWIERDSRWTRIGEALGKALNQRDPDRASPLCLRNAANGFFYQPPGVLPASGPDAQLTREPHNLARTFVGAFLVALGGIVRADAGEPTVESVQNSAWKAGAWLVAAIRNAPIQLDYFFQVASALTAEAAKFGDDASRDAIAAAFVRRGILPVHALDDSWPTNPQTIDTGVAPVPPPPPGAALSRGIAGAAGFAGTASEISGALDARRFGLKRGTLLLPSSTERPQPASARAFDPTGFHRSFSGTLPMTASGPGAAAAPAFAPATGAAPASPPVVQPLKHEEDYVRYLFQRGRVEFSPETLSLTAAGPVAARKTHRLTAVDGQVELERIGFDCGFD